MRHRFTLRRKRLTAVIRAKSANISKTDVVIAKAKFGAAVKVAASRVRIAVDISLVVREEAVMATKVSVNRSKRVRAISAADWEGDLCVT